MEKRLHIFIVIGLVLFGFIMGSIFDKNISQALYINNFTFGIIVSAFGLFVTYCLAAMLDGALFGEALKMDRKNYKIIITILTILFLIVIIYLCGETVFDANGLNKKGIGYKLLGIGIFTVILPIFFFLGYKFDKDIKNDKLWIILSILLIASIAALLTGGLGIKEIFHRPRYRTVVKEIDGIEFHNWWVPFKEYKNYITEVVTKEEFKSFPSGHATTSMISIIGFTYLFLFNPKLKKYQTILFYTGVAYSFFISLTRIMAGAHFLTDVSFGSLISLIAFFIANEIILRKNLIKEEIE